MYLHYCGYGDLDELIIRHRDAGKPIPEPFLWMTFSILAKAGVAMERGHIDPDELPEESWKEEIIHRDLKPANIFLDYNLLRYFEIYPTPKVGDFGLAIKTSNKNELNPEIYLNQGGKKTDRNGPSRRMRHLLTLLPVDARYSRIYRAGANGLC